MCVSEREGGETQVTGIPLALYQRQCWVRFPYKHSVLASSGRGGSSAQDHRAEHACVLSDHIPWQNMTMVQ